jgi:hypothetical protein
VAVINESNEINVSIYEQGEAKALQEKVFKSNDNKK